MKCHFLSALERSNQERPISLQNTIRLIFALGITCKWPEIRELKQTTTATATRTPPNKRFNE